MDPATISAVINSRQERFGGDDAVSDTPSAIPEDDNYQTRSNVTIIETSEIVEISFLLSSPEDS